MLARFDKISPGARTKLDRARSLKKEIIQTRDLRLNKISASARAKNWAELIKRYAVSLRPAGAPIGRFVRVVFALLTVRRPRRAVSGGSQFDRARSLE